VCDNLQKITKQTTLKSLENFLGKPDRKFSKANTIWTYDNLGLMIYIDPSNSMLRSIEFEFKKENFDFTPRKTYQGSFMIYGANISEKTSIANLKEIKELNFEYSVLQMYSFTTSYLLLTLEYSDNMTRLESVGIAFKE